MSIQAYRASASDYLVIETGQPRDNVRIGRGASLAAAIIDARGETGGTPIQCTGPDSGHDRGIAWAINAGWITREEWDDMGSVDEDRVTAALGRVAETAWTREVAS